jgi:hypothetical protein
MQVNNIQILFDCYFLDKEDRTTKTFINFVYFNGKFININVTGPEMRFPNDQINSFIKGETNSLNIDANDEIGIEMNQEYVYIYEGDSDLDDVYGIVKYNSTDSEVTRKFEEEGIGRYIKIPRDYFISVLDSSHKDFTAVYERYVNDQYFLDDPSEFNLRYRFNHQSKNAIKTLIWMRKELNYDINKISNENFDIVIKSLSKFIDDINEVI